MGFGTLLRRLLRVDARPAVAEFPAMHGKISPPRDVRVAARSQLLALSLRRQHPGSGSNLRHLVTIGGISMRWWQSAFRTVAAQKIPVAVVGAVAANAYMPARNTDGLDLAVASRHRAIAEDSLRAAGWQALGSLSLYGGLTGSAWKKQGREVGLLGVPDWWGEEAIVEAQGNLASHRMPTLTLPYLVVMKLISARPQDSADIARMLGAANDARIDEVREAVRRVLPEETDVVDQLVVLGRLEYGA